MRGDLGGCAVRTGRGVGERETWKGKGEKCNRKGEREWVVWIVAYEKGSLNVFLTLPESI